MTDGIIQEVLNKFNKTHRRGCQCDRCLVISYIKLELIEKIKLRLDLHNSAWHFDKEYLDSLTKDLIGDNQE